ncbi:Hypothetical predicted protein, partial [Marmota monax]
GHLPTTADPTAKRRQLRTAPPSATMLRPLCCSAPPWPSATQQILAVPTHVKTKV